MSGAKEIIAGPPGKDVSISIEAQQSLYDMLPKDIKAKGELTIAVEANAGLPNSITSPDGKERGMIIDMANVLGAVIGIPVDLKTASFDQLIPGLQANRYDLSTSTFSDTLPRREVVDFVNDLTLVSPLLVVPASNKDLVGTLTPETTCGMTAAVNKGGAEADVLVNASKECVQSGKQPIDIQLFPSNPVAMLAVKSGRAKTAIFSGAQAKWIVENDKTLALGAPTPGIIGYDGIALPKGSPLTPVIRAALLNLHSSGTWLQILKLYGAQDMAPTEKVINNLKPFDPKDANG